MLTVLLTGLKLLLQTKRVLNASRMRLVCFVSYLTIAVANEPRCATILKYLIKYICRWPPAGVRTHSVWILWLKDQGSSTWTLLSGTVVLGAYWNWNREHTKAQTANRKQFQPVEWNKTVLGTHESGVEVVGLAGGGVNIHLQKYIRLRKRRIIGSQDCFISTNGDISRSGHIRKVWNINCGLWLWF